MATTDMRVREQSLFPAGMRWVYVAAVLLVCGLIVRLLWYPVVTTDYTYFVKAWTDTLGAHRGLSAFSFPFADYAPLYLYFLKFLSLFPIPTLAGAKTLSLAFDALMAFGGYLVLRNFSRWSTRTDLLVLAAVSIFVLPTVMMNSSLWGQSDSLYAAGVIFSFLFVLIDAPFFAALVFGFALSMKMQAIFFAPVLIGYLLRDRATWKYLLVPPAVFILSVMPAWMAGGEPGYWFLIYAHQASEYPYLSVSAQSVYAFLQPLTLSAEATSAAFWAGLAIAVLVAVLVIMFVRTLPQLDPKILTLLALGSALLLPYFLPRMHERYFYLADIFAVLYAFMQPGRALIPIFVVFTSLISYMPFLSAQVPFLAPFAIDVRLPAALLLVPIFLIVKDGWGTLSTLLRESRAESLPAVSR